MSLPHRVSWSWVEKATSIYEDRGNAHFHSNTKALDFGWQFTLNDSELLMALARMKSVLTRVRSSQSFLLSGFHFPYLVKAVKKTDSHLKDKEKVGLNYVLLPLPPLYCLLLFSSLLSPPLHSPLSLLSPIRPISKNFWHCLFCLADWWRILHARFMNLCKFFIVKLILWQLWCAYTFQC